jgi:ATP-dependent DNA ligase
MGFISPMLASGMPKKGISYESGRYIAEEKYDGHRLIVEVGTREVFAWGRYGIARELPESLMWQLRQLDPGVYDGELIVPGGKSHNVVELTKKGILRFVAFDILKSFKHDVTWHMWDGRREMLAEAFENVNGPDVKMSAFVRVYSLDQVLDVYKKVIDDGGEGLILKDKLSEYMAGKRPSGVWIKMKEQITVVMEIIGFAPGRNGPYSRAVVEGEDLRRTSVKVLNNELLAAVNLNPRSFLGRQLRIEYQGRTEDGSYRHPRWDHLLDEE